MTRDTVYKYLWWTFLIAIWSFWLFGVFIRTAGAQEVIPTEDCYAIYDDAICDWMAESTSVHGEQYADPIIQELVESEVGGYEIGTQIPTGHGDSYEFTPDIAKAVRAAFAPEHQRWGAALVGCESRGNWRAISPTSDYGIFQINRIWLAGVVDPFSYYTQVTKAREVFGYQGRSGWSCNRVAAGVSGS